MQNDFVGNKLFWKWVKRTKQGAQEKTYGIQNEHEIGSCSNLTIISVRNNRLQEVPAELGHLPSIRMINLSENLLCNLPVSILKLSHLTALWLSNNQNTPLVTLHKEIDKETGQTVCVNFMLPQTIQDRYVACAHILEIPKGTANNSNEEHTTRSHPHIWFATEATEDKSCGLLRAPTPYPKELRAMSKHVRNMQQSSKRASREVDEVVPLLGELVSPESSDVQIKEAKRSPDMSSSGPVKSQVMQVLVNQARYKNSITWQNNATASSRPSENSSVHASGDRPIIREAKFVRHINSASLLQHAEKVNFIEPTSLQSQLLLVDSEYFKNQRLNIDPKTEQPLQPPPYHIAAAYSKQAIWFEHPPNCAKDSKLLRVPSSSESLHKAFVVGGE
uniref:Leucine-rich repeat-containing protein 1 n=1 Tax=Timema bartmani TaxID=61472 RepID=A0A7R9I0P4_9NEOP|nr:unnamed protein product [Timema bartmani]